jgi:cysteine synthase A
MDFDIPFIDLGENIYGMNFSVFPTASVKSIAIFHILNGRRYEIGERTVVMPSSGNAGIAAAAKCAELGKDFICFMPTNFRGSFRERIIKHYGGEVEFRGNDTNETIRYVNDLVKQDSGYWLCDQFGDPNAMLAHQNYTGSQVLQFIHKLAGDGYKKILVALPVGSSATALGVARRLLRMKLPCEVVVYTLEATGIAGWRNRKTWQVPPIWEAYEGDKVLPNRYVVSVEDASNTAKFYTSRRGISMSNSAGGAVFGASQLLMGDVAQVAITTLADTGYKEL